MKIWLLDPSFTEQKYGRTGGEVELRDSHILAGAELVKEVQNAVRLLPI